jgi:hypothetical protein
LKGPDWALAIDRRLQAQFRLREVISRRYRLQSFPEISSAITLAADHCFYKETSFCDGESGIDCIIRELLMDDRQKDGPAPETATAVANNRPAAGYAEPHIAFWPGN